MNYFTYCYLKKPCSYHFAAKVSDIETLREASEYDLNERDDDGRTPTHWAAYKGNVQALIAILSRG